jgi:short-subunit dehydrogenase
MKQNCGKETIMAESPVVIITGASSGIGEATALNLGDQGYRVVLAARSERKLETLAEEIRSAGGTALAVPLDLTRLEDIQNLVAVVKENFGQIDILVNNAGFAHHLWLDHQDPEADIQFQLQVNLVGMIQLTREVLPDMLAAGRGQIIHISSVASFIGIPTYTMYNASKFGSRGFMAGLRRELRGTGVVVSEVYPGAVDTDFGQAPDTGWNTRTVTPEFALVSPQDVADRISRVIEHRLKKTVIPGFMWLVILADAHLPWLVSWVLSKYFYIKKGKRFSWGVRPE